MRRLSLIRPNQHPVSFTRMSVAEPTTTERKPRPMTDEETIQKLMSLRLSTMARAFRDQLADSPGSQLNFSERVALMVDRKWTDRENRRLARLMQSARLSISDAAMENISCDSARGIDKSVVRDLATCKWITNKQNVVVVGKTGVGKTFFAAALAQAACRHGLRGPVHPRAAIARRDLHRAGRGDVRRHTWPSRQARCTGP